MTVKNIRVLAFTSCGHCPIAKVELKGKNRPMKVYCPLQREEEGTFRLVFETSYIGQLHEDCPLTSLEQLVEQLSGKTAEEQAELVAEIHRIQFSVTCGQGSPTGMDLDRALPNRKGD